MLSHLKSTEGKKIFEWYPTYPAKNLTRWTLTGQQGQHINYQQDDF